MGENGGGSGALQMMLCKFTVLVAITLLSIEILHYELP
jgi:hypothetical protein